MFNFLKTSTRVLFLMLIGIAIALLLSPQMQLKGIDKLPNLPKLGTLEQKPNADKNPIIRLVEQDEKKNNQFQCTAIVFDTQYAVTAAHCINEDNGLLRKKDFAIFDREGNDTGIRATPAGINNRMDFGILKGDFSSFLMADIAVYDTPLFSAPGPFMTCGYAYGQKFMTCNRFIPRSNYYFHVIGIGSMFPGMSGGPVVDQSTNKVVGVNSSVSDGYVTVVPLTGLVGTFDLEP